MGTFTLDGRPVAFAEGQTILQAAVAAGAYIPHLCFHPEFKPHGSCKVCTVRVGGREAASCTTRATEGAVVESDTPDLNADRRALVQMLFVEGNHFCPSCEKSGDCKLQATAYDLGMVSPHFDHFFPDRPVDASHPELLLDFNRCILCSRCVRACADVEGAHVWDIGGRGISSLLVCELNRSWGESRHCTACGKCVQSCPTGALAEKGFAVEEMTKKPEPVSRIATFREVRP